MREWGWCLETLAEGGLRRLPITALPFRVGRQHDLELVLLADSVSKVHAEIYAAGSGLRVRDCGSRNGTFVNRALVKDAALREGDVLHFANYEFRLGRSEQTAQSPLARQFDTASTADAGPLQHRFVEGTRELRELLSHGQVTTVFQPIVLFSEGTVAAYEALGRGRHPQLPEEPRELFRIAESINAAAELSRLFRRKAVELAAARRGLPTIFLNTHPSELSQPGLIESLEELRAIAPHTDLTLEIHESVLAGPSAIAELRAFLVERNIATAFDNFGSGQARLHELAETPPHYLKFAQRFVKDLDQAPPAKRRILQSLLALAGELRVKTVAEGIETEAEARACAEIGFTYGQGSYLGPPRAIEEIRGPSRP